MAVEQGVVLVAAQHEQAPLTLPSLLTILKTFGQNLSVYVLCAALTAQAAQLG
jgi:hypothetical protein